MKAAEAPFEFVTVSYLTRIGNQSAGALAELLTGLEHCSDASIFHHTFQTLGSHHFLTEGFSNDFAQWVLADTNRNDLAEQLAALDIRDYVSIAALRRDLCRLVGEFCTAFPHFAGQSALERFYFSRAECANPRRIPGGHRTPQPLGLLFSFHLVTAAAATADKRFFALACRWPGTQISGRKRQSN
ncbi:MAG: hypothetical protein DMG49_08885 [Acidobacteria bacterium]|nr:MAG: hypothetical protein DMG49_08885 [Acidobacteriota bacterium]